MHIYALNYTWMMLKKLQCFVVTFLFYLINSSFQVQISHFSNLFLAFLNHQINSKPLLNSNMGLIYFLFYFRPSSTVLRTHRDKSWVDSTTKNTLKYLTTYSADLPNQPKYLGCLKKALIVCPQSVELFIKIGLTYHT